MQIKEPSFPSNSREGDINNEAEQDKNERLWKEQIAKSQAERVKHKKSPTLKETKQRLENEGVDIQSLETPNLEKAKELHENPMGKGWEVVGDSSQETSKKKRAETIQEAHDYIDSVEREQQDEVQSLVAQLNDKLPGNLMVERADLTKTGFEIVIKNEKGEPVYGQDNLPPESWQAYDKLYYALEEKFKSQNPSAKNSEPVITGKPQGLWSKIKKFFDGK